MSVLEKLRQKKNRPVVPTREDELVSALTPPVPTGELSDPDTAEESGAPLLLIDPHEPQEELFQIHDPAPTPIAHKLVASLTSTNTSGEIDIPAITELQAQLDRIPPTARHSTIALEVDLGDEITSYCRQQKITVETFLEATWLALQEHPDVLKQVTIEAKQRYNRRKEAGRLRRLITTIRKQLEG